MHDSVVAEDRKAASQISFLARARTCGPKPPLPSHSCGSLLDQPAQHIAHARNSADGLRKARDTLKPSTYGCRRQHFEHKPGGRPWVARCAPRNPNAAPGRTRADVGQALLTPVRAPRYASSSDFHTHTAEPPLVGTGRGSRTPRFACCGLIDQFGDTAKVCWMA